MAQTQSKRDDNTIRSERDQRTLDNLDKSAKKKLNSINNGFRCDCPSCSSSETRNKKVVSKNFSKSSEGSSRNRKNNKFTTPSRRKFRTGYDHSYQDVVYPSLCDKPRVLEKSIKTTNTIKNQNTTEVRSVKVTKSFQRTCCSALYPEAESNLEKTSNKLTRPPRGRRNSVLSLSSSVDEHSGVSFSISSTDDTSDNQRIKKRENKLKRFRNRNSLENDFKHSNEQTYQRTATTNRSQEASHKRQGAFPSDFENRETSHKVKNYQMEKLPYESLHENPKLDRILQDPVADGLVTHVRNKTADNYPVIYNCPESSSHQGDEKNDQSSRQQHQQNKKSFSSFKDDDLAKIEELIIPSRKNNDSSINKSYSPSGNSEAGSSKYWQQFQEKLENISASYREISSGLKEMRRDVESVKPNSKEREITREYPIKKFSFQTQIVGDDIDRMLSINKPSRRSNMDEPTSNSTQSSENTNLRALDKEKNSLSGPEQIDPTEDVINLTDKPIINNEDSTQPSQLEAALNNCQFEFCKCDLQDDRQEPTGKNTSPMTKDSSMPREPSRERTKRHDFSLPKIVIPESSERLDVRKMFVYPSEENQEPPLTVYRTSSFVKCEIKENRNIGFRYVITYVQKYVSPTWKPDKQSKRKASSQEHVKTDDYG